MTELLLLLLGAALGIVLREVWVFRQICADAERTGRPPARKGRASLRRALLSPLGRYVLDLLQDPAAWKLRGLDLAHASGLVLDMKPDVGFDIEDPGGVTDFIDELPWLDRQLLWRRVRDLHQHLKYPEILRAP